MHACERTVQATHHPPHAAHTARPHAILLSSAVCLHPSLPSVPTQAYHARNSLPQPSTLLDIGCSTGISSRWYQQAFPAASITGLDLSPYFLAVAELEERWVEVVQCVRVCLRKVV
jgi:methylase of polypeptide subunit release factors